MKKSKKSMSSMLPSDYCNSREEILQDIDKIFIWKVTRVPWCEKIPFIG